MHPNSETGQSNPSKMHPDGAHLDKPDRLAREQYSISDLTQEFNCTARALRFYEDEGLIAPERVGLTRIYSKRDRARLAWIMRAKNVGFSLSEIREMIDLYDLDDGRLEQRRVTIEKCRQHIAKLKAQRADIDSSIKDLTRFVKNIEALVAEETGANLNDPSSGESDDPQQGANSDN